MIDLDVIKARCEAATPGPWYVDRGGEFDDPYYSIPSVCRDRYGDNSLMVGSDKATAEFIAHARTDVPALVAEVERLRAEVEGLTDAYDSLKSDADALVGGLKLDYADCESVGMEWMRRAHRAEALLAGVQTPRRGASNYRVDL